MELSEAHVRQLLADISGSGSRTQAERGMELLYLAFSPVIRNYLWKNFRQDEEWIGDVIQETFIDVWKHAERFRGDSQFKSWLIGVARHKAMDALRKERSGHEPLEDSEDTLSDDAEPITDLLQREQVRASVHYCLETLAASGKLSFEQREALYLAYVEDLDLAEMAQATGSPENRMKGRLFHARRRITQCLRRRLGLGGTHE